MIEKNFFDKFRPKMGVSACLRGENVRYNGGHCKSDFVQQLSEYFEYTHVCPELEAGFGIPRPTMQLYDKGGETRLRFSDSKQDITEKMNGYIKKKVILPELGQLSGFILKKGSPSCGVFRQKVYHESGLPLRNDQGLFAKALQDQFPFLPMEDEGRLNDPQLRENFITRVYAYYYWENMEVETAGIGKLIHFHQIFKYRLIAHSPSSQKILGNIVANAKADLAQSVLKYKELFFTTMNNFPNEKGHVNVLHHIFGYVSDFLDSFDKKELLDKFEDFRLGRAPLVIALSQVNALARKHQDKYLLEQVYLNPHPVKLGLFNQIFKK